MAKKQKRRISGRMLLVIAVLILGFGWLRAGMPGMNRVTGYLRIAHVKQAQLPDWVDQQLIGVDGTSRRGTELENIRDVVIHYVGNPGTSAQQNRNWYANPESQVSSHFIVGLEGEVIQCVPLWEMSSASNHRNKDTISIEICHPDESGKFTRESYEAAVKLTAWLVENCFLDSGDIIRHHDITGKDCPRYFVSNEQAWEDFRRDVDKLIRAGEETP